MGYSIEELRIKKRPELKNICKSLKLKRYYSLKKKELVQLIYDKTNLKIKEKTNNSVTKENFKELFITDEEHVPKTEYKVKSGKSNILITKKKQKEDKLIIKTKTTLSDNNKYQLLKKNTVVKIGNVNKYPLSKTSINKTKLLNKHKKEDIFTKKIAIRDVLKSTKPPINNRKNLKVNKNKFESLQKYISESKNIKYNGKTIKKQRNYNLPRYPNKNKEEIEQSYKNIKHKIKASKHALFSINDKALEYRVSLLQKMNHNPNGKERIGIDKLVNMYIKNSKLSIRKGMDEYLETEKILKTELEFHKTKNSKNKNNILKIVSNSTEKPISSNLIENINKQEKSVTNKRNNNEQIFQKVNPSHSSLKNVEKTRRGILKAKSRKRNLSLGKQIIFWNNYIKKYPNSKMANIYRLKIKNIPLEFKFIQDEIEKKNKLSKINKLDINNLITKYRKKYKTKMSSYLK